MEKSRDLRPCEANNWAWVSVCPSTLRAKLFSAKQSMTTAEYGEYLNQIIYEEDDYTSTRIPNTPLKLAIKNTYNKAIIEMLLLQGADPNKHQTEDGIHFTTALIDAVTTNNLRVIEVLLNHGADPNIATLMSEDTNNLPLSIAASQRQDKIVRLLLDAGALVDGPDPEATKFPIHYAIESGAPHIVKTLIERGANIRVLDKDDKSLMWYAAKADVDVCGQLVSLLLEHFPKNFGTHDDSLNQAILNTCFEAAQKLMKSGWCLKQPLKKHITKAISMTICNQLSNQDRYRHISKQNKAQICREVMSFLQDLRSICDDIDIKTIATAGLAWFLLHQQEPDLEYINFLLTLGIDPSMPLDPDLTGTTRYSSCFSALFKGANQWKSLGIHRCCAKIGAILDMLLNADCGRKLPLLDEAFLCESFESAKSLIQSGWTLQQIDKVMVKAISKTICRKLVNVLDYGHNADNEQRDIISMIGKLCVMYKPSFIRPIACAALAQVFVSDGKYSRSSIVHLLLASGADPTVRLSGEYLHKVPESLVSPITVLTALVHKNNATTRKMHDGGEILDVLIEYLPPRIANIVDLDLLSWAFANDHFEASQKLIQYGCKLQQADTEVISSICRTVFKHLRNNTYIEQKQVVGLIENLKPMCEPDDVRQIATAVLVKIISSWLNFGTTNIVHQLLVLGADPSLETGKTGVYGVHKAPLPMFFQSHFSKDMLKQWWNTLVHLLAAGCKINEKCISFTGSCSVSMLCMAIDKGDLTLTQMLYEAGASVNTLGDLQQHNLGENNRLKTYVEEVIQQPRKLSDLCVIEIRQQLYSVHQYIPNAVTKLNVPPKIQDVISLKHLQALVEDVNVKDNESYAVPPLPIAHHHVARGGSHYPVTLASSASSASSSPIHFDYYDSDDYLDEYDEYVEYDHYYDYYD